MQSLFVATWEFGEIAVREAYARWQAETGAHPLGDALEQALTAGIGKVELDPTIPTVGIGGLPNRDGIMQLDAALMVGSDLTCGAVGAMTHTAPAIHVAAALRSHAVAGPARPVMLVGEGADQFAREHGFAPITLLTDSAGHIWKEWSATTTDRNKAIGHDTLSVIGWAARENEKEVIAAVATSGLGFKHPGRLGDSPIIGSGLYADVKAGACVCTGLGEEMIRMAFAVRVVDRMQAGMSPTEACESVLKQLIARRSQVANMGVHALAVNPAGDIGAVTTGQDETPFVWHAMVDGEHIRVAPQAVT